VWFKIGLFCINNPRLVLKILIGIVFVVLFLLLILIAPFALFISGPLSPPSMIDIYVQGADRAEEDTVDGYYGKLEIDPLDVLSVSAVQRKQDFSSASVRRAQDLARRFIEHTGYREKKIGYEATFDEYGNETGEKPVYRDFPVFRIRSIEEVTADMGFTGEEARWAREMRGNERGIVSVAGTGSGAALNWWTEVRHMFPRGMEVNVTDVTTGRSFMMRRTGGRNHADSEPVSTMDSMIIFDIWGGWSWNRRPIIVEINGQLIAASMNGMPHGFDTIPGNGIRGHLCIHFRHSMTHIGNRECLEHQAMVLRASGAIYDRVVRATDIYDFTPELEPDIVSPVDFDREYNR